MISGTISWAKNFWKLQASLTKFELEALKLINYCLTCFLKYYHADSDYGTLRPKVYIKTAKLQFGGNQYAL